MKFFLILNEKCEIKKFVDNWIKVEINFKISESHRKNFDTKLHFPKHNLY